MPHLFKPPVPGNQVAKPDGCDCDGRKVGAVDYCPVLPDAEQVGPKHDVARDDEHDNGDWNAGVLSVLELAVDFANFFIRIRVLVQDNGSKLCVGVAGFQD